MKRARAIALIVLAVVLLTASTVYAFANAPEKGSMGVWGYVASGKTANLKVVDQLGAETLMVNRAEAPGSAWIVVHTDDDGMPGERVGLKHIDKGVNDDVRVKLKGVESESVIVAVHADKGSSGKFEFDMDDKTGSPDRPFFVQRKELAKSVKVREPGADSDAPAGMGE